MTITQIAKQGESGDLFARESWDQPFKFWYGFNPHGRMEASDSGNLLPTRHELMADDWVFVTKCEKCRKVTDYASDGNSGGFLCRDCVWAAA
jgi:hypothetical protein